MKHYPAQPADQRLFSMQQDYERMVLRNPIEAIDVVRYEFDRPFYGDGWHVTEIAPHGVPFRWTGKPTATLLLPLRSGVDYAISFDLVHALTGDVWETFRFCVGDVRVSLEREATTGGYSCRGVIPGHLIVEGELAALQFCVPQTRTPVEFGNSGDERQLGVAVSRLEISPVASAAGGGQ